MTNDPSTHSLLCSALFLPSVRSKPFKASYGERCKLLQRGLGQSPSRNWIWCILALKSDIWWQQISDFPENQIAIIPCYSLFETTFRRQKIFGGIAYVPFKYATASVRLRLTETPEFIARYDTKMQMCRSKILTDRYIQLDSVRHDASLAKRITSYWLSGRLQKTHTVIAHPFDQREAQMDRGEIARPSINMLYSSIQAVLQINHQKSTHTVTLQTHMQCTLAWDMMFLKVNITLFYWLWLDVHRVNMRLSSINA